MPTPIRKKYKKMKIKFDEVMKVSNQSYINEHGTSEKPQHPLADTIADNI
jgi:hypothetical protein